jgi:L-rhamnose isomerase
MVALDEITLSIHAWQGDDVTGFEHTDHALTGGCQVTGNYPGRCPPAGVTLAAGAIYFPAAAEVFR